MPGRGLYRVELVDVCSQGAAGGVRAIRWAIHQVCFRGGTEGVWLFEPFLLRGLS